MQIDAKVIFQNNNTISGNAGLYVDNENDRIINKYGGERMSLFKTSNK